MLQGSLLEGTFGAWSPATNEMELCDVAAAAQGDDDDDEEEEEEGEVSEVDMVSDGEGEAQEDQEEVL